MAASLAIGSVAGVGYAQTTSPAPTATTEVDAIVVAGARGRPRTVVDSPVPIDVFSSDEIAKVPNTDMHDLLTTLIPSYTVSRNSNSDGNTAIRPPSLRGLPSHNTLMLVNGHRRHRSASVPNAGYGAQAADVALIPQLALKSVEVLRDGAAAQYGSDAIAGVLNFILKDASNGGTISAQGGQFYKGDGFDWSVAGNIGLPIGDRGFVNLTAERVFQQATHRGTQFINPSFDPSQEVLINPAFKAAVGNLGKPLQRVGQPKIDGFHSFVNAGYDVSDTVSVYSFGSFAKSDTLAHGGYRFPTHGQAVLDNPIRLADGSVYRLNTLYPGGFKPEYSGVIKDRSLAGGVKFEGLGIQWDASASYGHNDFSYKLDNVPNPSMGPTTPAHFRPGGTIQQEISYNLDAVTEVLPDLFASPLTLNFGIENRQESFEIYAGDPDSYRVGIYAKPDPYGFCNSVTHTATAAGAGVAGLNCGNYLASAADGFAGRDPAYNVLDVGSAGIPGTPPEYAGKFNRKSSSAYLEGTVDITDKLFLDLATRYEKYDAIDAKLNSKAALLFKMTDWLNIRGSIGKGFRAPSVGQTNMTNIRITFTDGIPTNVATLAPQSQAARALGASALRPETSNNLSLGFTARTPLGITLTVDGYQIKTSDTIYMTSLINITPSILTALQAANVPGAATLSQVRFFTNALDSKASGVDVVANYRTSWDNGSNTTFMAAWNYNKFEATKVLSPLVNSVTIFNFGRSQPKWRGSLTANHTMGNWSALARASITSGYQVQNTTGAMAVQKYHAETMLDLEGTYTFDNELAISVGARNVLDNYPEKDATNPRTSGALYRDGPVSYQGGYYYMRVRKSF